MKEVTQTPTKRKDPEVELVEQTEPPKVEAKEPRTDVRSRLEHIKSREGVIGYILRASTSASVDLKDPSKIIDYAILSAAALESGESLSRGFSLGKINSILLEGKDVKILSMTVGEQKLSVFMEKNVNHNSVYRDLA